MNRNTMLPAIIIAVVLTTSFGIISIGHTISNKRIQFVDYWLNAYGVDYRVFFEASQNIIHGQSPYAATLDVNRYDYTPIPAIANIVFVPLGFDRARRLLYALIPLSLAFGYVLLTSVFSFSETHRSQVLLTGLACLLFGAPFYFLIQRENIDGWVFMFLCLGLFFSQKDRMEAWSALFLSLAIGFKIYPVLLVLPVCLYRKWRLLFWIGLWLAILAGVSLFWCSGFESSLAGRLTVFYLRSNGSMYAGVVGIQELLGALGLPAPGPLVKFPMAMAALMYGVFLSLVILADFRLSKSNKYEIASATMYVPFMLAWPQLVFVYEFVVCLIVIPTMCHLWESNGNRAQRVIIVIIAIGIALSQSQAFALYNLTGSRLAYAVPPLGLLVIMGGVTVYKLLALRPPLVEGAGGLEKLTGSTA